MIPETCKIRNFFLLLVTFLLPVLFFGLESATSTPVTRKSLGLKGPVRLLRVSLIDDYTNKFEKRQGSDARLLLQRFFNRKGQQTRSITYTNNRPATNTAAPNEAAWFGKQRRYYNENGEPAGVDIFDASGLLLIEIRITNAQTNRTRYFYDSDGHIQERQRVISTGDTYQEKIFRAGEAIQTQSYSNSQLLARTNHKQNRSSFYLYNNSGQVTIRKEYENGKLLRHIHFQYNSAGEPAEKTVYRQPGMLARKTVFRYNGERQLTGKSTYAQNGALLGLTRIRYRPSGQIKLEEQTDKNGDVTNRTVYQYTDRTLTSSVLSNQQMRRVRTFHEDYIREEYYSPPTGPERVLFHIYSGNQDQEDRQLLVSGVKDGPKTRLLWKTNYQYNDYGDLAKKVILQFNYRTNRLIAGTNTNRIMIATNTNIHTNTNNSNTNTAAPEPDNSDSPDTPDNPDNPDTENEESYTNQITVIYTNSIDIQRERTALVYRYTYDQHGNWIRKTRYDEKRQYGKIRRQKVETKLRKIEYYW